MFKDFINSLISSFVVFLPALILNDPSILSSSSFIADKTWDLSIVPDVQADPLDNAMWGIKLNNCSATFPLIAIFKLFGILCSIFPLITYSKLEFSKSESSEEEYTPKLFSDDQSFQTEESLEKNEFENKDTDQLFDQDLNEEEDFEIPAFLRKQKF